MTTDITKDDHKDIYKYVTPYEYDHELFLDRVMYYKIAKDFNNLLETTEDETLKQSTHGQRYEYNKIYRANYLLRVNDPDKLLEWFEDIKDIKDSNM